MRFDGPEIARSVVVFPAPFAPRTATTSPSPTTNETPSRATLSPKRRVTSRTSRKAIRRRPWNRADAP
jgi:hypothetical protein